MVPIDFVVHFQLSIYDGNPISVLSELAELVEGKQITNSDDIKTFLKELEERLPPSDNLYQRATTAFAMTPMFTHLLLLP